MKKSLKRIIVAAMILSTSSLMALTAVAADPGLTGKNYIVRTKITDVPEITFSHMASNQTSTVDEVTYAVSRTKKFTGSLSSTAEANALIASCSITAEVSFGTEENSSTSCKWTIPPYTTVTCRYGSAVVNTTGTMENWFNGRITSSRTVSSVYTYTSYSDKIVN